jgi:hypothetical protein
MTTGEAFGVLRSLGVEIPSPAVFSADLVDLLCQRAEDRGAEAETIVAIRNALGADSRSPRLRGL